MEKRELVVGRDLNRVPLHNVVPRAVPFAIGIAPSDFCNFKCKYCAQATSAGVRNPQIVSVENFKIIVGQIEELIRKGGENVKIIRFIGNGEPLLNKNLPEMLKYISEKKIADRYEVTTNGSLLTHELTDKLVDSGLTRLLISIQGVHAKSYEQICGYKIDFERLVDEITYFYNKSRGKCRLMIKTVNLSVASSEEREKFYRIFSPICDEISIENVIAACEDVDYKKIMSEEALEKTRYGTILEKKVCCDTLFMNMNVHSNGNVDVCGCIYPPLFIGNIYKQSLADLWNGRVHKEVMLKHLTGRRNEIEVCSKCTSIDHYNGFTEDNLDPYLDEILEKVKRL